jgi:TolB-like protein/class 3 adenylate cyclase/Tfp pilus assembly protein PilF
VNPQDTPAETASDLQLEIAHLLLIDVVGYSKLLVNEQIELLQELKRVVRSTESFRTAEASGELIRVPTGDGMALVFFHSPEQPARCALELSRELQDHPSIRLRMGIHSGPINRVTDVNEKANIAGPGINVAQRVMDCGDAGHILLSAHVAEDLCQYRHWQPCLHDLGEYEVKNKLRLHLFNLAKNGLGNPQVPEKLRRGRRRPASAISVRPITASRWPKPGLTIAFLVCAIALVIGSLIFFNRTRPRAPARIARALSALAPIPAKSIAVLPFENLSDDKENAYFADGVQDEILTGLSRVADLKVISRTSVMQYKAGPRRNLREVATELRVAHVLEGTVQRAGGRVRVNAQLIDARTDSQLWAERYDRDLADVFAIENELAEQIVSQLKAKLAPEEKAAIEKPPTTDFAAYDLYLRAKAILVTAAFNVGEKEKLFEGAQLLERAVARDPQFLLAYYELARTHDRLYILGIDHTAARLNLAGAAIERALKLGPNSGEAHLALAAHLYTRLDYDRARQELEIAKRALPNEPLVFELTGYIDRRQGRWDDCIRNLERAQELDPRNFFNLQQISLAYQKLRRFKKMAMALDRALMIVPKDAGTRVQRGWVDLEWRATPKPLHSVIQEVFAEDPSTAGGLAEFWLYVALCERDHDAAASALAVMTGDGCRNEGIPLPRAWCEGVAARARGDNLAARGAFTSARVQIEKTVLAQPEYAEALCVLGLVDAGLGRKEEAIREGRRAVELLPVAKDAINGALLIEYLAVIYAWTGEKDRALEELALAARIPSDVSYGQLSLHPYWDPLRGDPRFEKIVASLAPK